MIEAQVAMYSHISKLQRHLQISYRTLQFLLFLLYEQCLLECSSFNYGDYVNEIASDPYLIIRCELFRVTKRTDLTEKDRLIELDKLISLYTGGIGSLLNHKCQSLLKLVDELRAIVLMCYPTEASERKVFKANIANIHALLDFKIPCAATGLFEVFDHTSRTVHREVLLCKTEFMRIHTIAGIIQNFHEEYTESSKVLIRLRLMKLYIRYCLLIILGCAYDSMESVQQRDYLVRCTILPYYLNNGVYSIVKNIQRHSARKEDGSGITFEVLEAGKNIDREIMGYNACNHIMEKLLSGDKVNTYLTLHASVKLQDSECKTLYLDLFTDELRLFCFMVTSLRILKCAEPVQEGVKFPQWAIIYNKFLIFYGDVGLPGFCKLFVSAFYTSLGCPQDIGLNTTIQLLYKKVDHVHEYLKRNNVLGRLLADRLNWVNFEVQDLRRTAENRLKYSRLLRACHYVSYIQSSITHIRSVLHEISVFFASPPKNHDHVIVVEKVHDNYKSFYEFFSCNYPAEYDDSLLVDKIFGPSEDRFESVCLNVMRV